LKDIAVGLLWHMHQPFYKDPVAGTYVMPWVRLHAIRGYYDMIALLEEFPDIRCTFNLVPSLLAQILDYTEEGLRDEDFMLSQKSPADLTGEEKKQMLLRFFMCNEQTMIAPFPRYQGLFRKRGRITTPDELDAAAKDFSIQDFMDLQVLFNLTWTGFMARKSGELSELVKKGRSFTEAEKGRLLDYQIEIMGKIIPLYRKLLHLGQIEMTTSPFYHPIGPLVMNTGYALRSMDTPQPDEPFSHPEDLGVQIERSLAFHEQLFGSAPKGMWPPEGSVCPEMIELLSDKGFSWSATDEDILFASIRQARTGAWLYQPYRVVYDNAEISMFFRDKPLSDQIGFVYAKNQPQQAVNDFMHHMGNIYKAAKGYGFNPFVPIILDGENPWEYYPDGGEGFLRGLYERLGTSQEIRTSLYHEFIEQNPPVHTIANLYTGSWINRNFRIWIGHEEDRRAWEYLARTRNYVESKGARAHPLAWEEIYIAEGSDWFWWYGDEFNSATDEEFDQLFRTHLRNCYELHGEPPPPELFQSIIAPHDITPLRPPTGFVHPIIDGEVSHFFEWRKAGCFLPTGDSKSMYRHLPYISALYFGFDIDNLFFRIDFASPAKGMVVNLHIVQPKDLHIRIPLGSSRMALFHKQGDESFPLADLSSMAYQNVLEFKIPFKDMSALPSQRLRFSVSLLKDELEIERHPGSGLQSITIPDKSYERVMWHV